MTSEWFWHLGLRGILFWMHHFARLLDRTNFRIGISLKTTIVACCLLMILSGNGSGARSLKTRRHHSESETEMIMGDLFDQKISQILLGNWQKTSNANKFIASSMVWHSSCDTHQVYIYIYIYVHTYIYIYLYLYLYIYIYIFWHRHGHFHRNGDMSNGQVTQVSEMPSGSDLGPKGAERVEIFSWKPSGKKQHMYIWETPGVDRGLTCCFFVFCFFVLNWDCKEDMYNNQSYWTCWWKFRTHEMCFSSFLPGLSPGLSTLEWLGFSRVFADRLD